MSALYYQGCLGNTILIITQSYMARGTARLTVFQVSFTQKKKKKSGEHKMKH